MLPDATPLSSLNVGQLRALIAELMSAPVQPKEGPLFEETVKGLDGIADLFQVSRKTAQKYKDTFLKPAILQRQRTIITDVPFAKYLFNQHKAEK